jgi:DNA polymerase III epsilon subunit-like protein
MKVLVFDTETTGLPPKNCDISVNTLDNWPYIVQLSYIIFDDHTNRILKISDNIIKLPDNIIMCQENVNIHGITNELMKGKGVDLKNVLYEFMNDFEMVDRVVAHNMSFDINMLKVEIKRKIINDLIYFEKQCFDEYYEWLTISNKYVCTMQETIDLCGIELTNKRGKYFKFPKLSELHYKLFNTIPNNLHNSLNDVLVCLRCYCQLHNHIDILEYNVEFRYIFYTLLF